MSTVLLVLYRLIRCLSQELFLVMLERIELITFVLWICNPSPYHPGHRPISIYNCRVFLRTLLPGVSVLQLAPRPTRHVKIEFVYLSGFSAFASITEYAHLSLFIVVTRSLVPHIHLVIKKPPSIATGGLLKTFDVLRYIIRHNPPSTQSDTHGIL